MRAAIYIRVSTEEQKQEGYSVEAQKQRGIEYCKIHGYNIIGFFIDEAISGKSLKRPAVQEMFREVEKNNIDIIVMYRLDRLSRSLKDLANVIELLDKHDVAIKSTSEDLDISSLSGRAMVQMLGVFAEFERGSIAERVSMGREQRAREGLYSSPGCVFGYDYNKDSGLYTINSREAIIVREMFELHQRGKGVDYIVREFNRKGYRSSTGGDFNRTFVVRAFKKGWYYCGKFQYITKGGETLLLDAKNIPDPILTIEEFEASNKIYGANAKDQAKKNSNDEFIFKGKIRCHHCKTILHSNVSARRFNKDGSKHYYRYYKCYNIRQGRCKNRYWLASKVDDKFLEFLREFAENNTETSLELKKQQIHDLQSKKQLLEEMLAKESSKKKKLQQFLLDGTFTKVEFQELSVDINTSIVNLEKEILSINKEILEAKQFENLIQEKKIAYNISKEWNQLDYIKKKEFINMFIKNIFIDKTGITRIEFIF